MFELSIRRHEEGFGRWTTTIRPAFSAIVGLLLTFVAHAALAADCQFPCGFKSGDVMVRGRISEVLPYNVKSSIDLIGGQVEVPSMILPDADVSVFLSDRWSLTGQAGFVKTNIKIKDSIYGDINVGSVRSLSVSLAVQYHFETKGRLKPYVGAGVNRTWYFGENPAGGFVQDFNVSHSSPAPLLKAGFDYQLDDTWFATAEVKRVFPPTQTIENQGVTAKTNLDIFIAGIGIGYLF